MHNKTENQLETFGLLKLEDVAAAFLASNDSSC